MKLLIIVQARTGSTRLPGKILLPLAGKPLLYRQLERVMQSTLASGVVVATTSEQSDEPVRRICSELGVKCHDGHPTDLLDRHYRVALAEKAEAIVKIPSDCPLIDPVVIDRVLAMWQEEPGKFDFVSNLHPPSYPDGNDVEVMSFAALETAWREAGADFEREHTTPFIWERPERFRIGNVTWETGWDYSMTHRWTIDYTEDYLFIKRVYDELWTANAPAFTLSAILGLLEREPDIARINQRYAGVNWYRHHLHQLKTVTANQVREYHDQ